MVSEVTMVIMANEVKFPTIVTRSTVIFSLTMLTM
jgi:hypothetical protein